MPGTLYLIPCPIAEEGDVWDVLPAANRAVMASLDYFIVENTRSARRFLSKAKLGRPIEELEFRELNEHTVAGREVEELVAPIAAWPIRGRWWWRCATGAASASCRWWALRRFCWR